MVLMPTINWNNTPARPMVHPVLLAIPRAPEILPLPRRRADSTTGTRFSSLPVFFAAKVRHRRRAMPSGTVPEVMRTHMVEHIDFPGE